MRHKIYSNSATPNIQPSKPTIQLSYPIDLSEGFDEVEPHIPQIECHDDEFHRSDAPQEDENFHTNEDDLKNENKDGEEIVGINNETTVLSNYDFDTAVENSKALSVENVAASKLSKIYER